MSSQPLLSTPLEVIKSIEVSGFPIEVGILQDGTPFLSGRGLAKACGISNSTLVGWGEFTPQLEDKYRAGKMAALLATYGYGGDRLFVRIPDGTQFGGRANVSAYPYQVCMAFLDYYAFEANKEAARHSLRLLSEKQLPQFIYDAIGLQPPKAIQPPSDPVRESGCDRPPPPWENRPLRDGIPVGYFTVAQLAAGEWGRSRPIGLTVESAIVSPLNLDRAWSRHWHVHKLWEQHGQRFQLPTPETEYGPPLPTYIYPTSALDDFQQWFNWKYLPERFPSYLQRKMQQRGVAIPYLQQLPQAS
jgi:hypothetical protein